jgi:recombination protein RecR
VQDYPAPLAALVDELRRLPGIGQKTAQRLAFHLMKAPEGEVQRLAAALAGFRAALRLCTVCNAVAEGELCAYCADPARSDRTLCVVEEPLNLVVVERTRDFRGRYHVLHGALSPLSGVGPEELRIEGLLERVRRGGVEEVILATSPTVEGEATAVYLARLLKPLGVKVTRIAMGVPVGADLDWADEVTLAKALEGRREY